MKHLQFLEKRIKCKHSETSYLIKDPFPYLLLVVSSFLVNENALQTFLVLVNICASSIFFFF